MKREFLEGVLVLQQPQKIEKSLYLLENIGKIIGKLIASFDFKAKIYCLFTTGGHNLCVEFTVVMPFSMHFIRASSKTNRFMSFFLYFFACEGEKLRNSKAFLLVL